MADAVYTSAIYIAQPKEKIVFNKILELTLAQDQKDSLQRVGKAIVKYSLVRLQVFIAGLKKRALLLFPLTGKSSKLSLQLPVNV